MSVRSNLFLIFINFSDVRNALTQQKKSEVIHLIINIY